MRKFISPSALAGAAGYSVCECASMSPKVLCRVFWAFLLFGSFARGETPAVRTDLYGDPLPAGAIARLGTVRWRHPAVVESIVFSPDGKLIASTCAQKGDGVRIWDAATGREIRRLKVEDNVEVHVHAFTPDGKALLIDSDDRILALHDVATCRQLRCFPATKERLRSVALSRDGKCVAYGGDEPILRLCDPASGRELHRLRGHDEGVWRVAFAPDGKSLASTGRDNTLRLWDVVSGKCLRTVKIGESYTVVFAPDGRTLAWEDNEGAIRLMDLARGCIYRTINAQKGSINHLTFAPDGKLLASAGPNLHLWDTATGVEHPHTKRAAINASCAVFAPDGKTLALTYFNPTLRLWDVDKGRDKPSPEGHEDVAEAIAVAPDGQCLLTTGQLGTIRLWEISTGRPRCVWAQEISAFTQGTAYPVAFAPDSQSFAVADDKGIVRVRETKTGRQRSVLLTGLRQDIIRLAYSPDGQRLAVGCATQVQVWDLASKKRLQQISHPPPEAHDFFTVPLYELFFRGRQPCLLMLPEKGYAVIGDLQHGARREILVERGWDTGSTALSADGKTLALSTKAPSDILQLWEITADRERARLHSKINFNGPLALAADGRTVAATHEDGSIRLWSVVTGTEVKRIRHPIEVKSIAFAPDGKALITTHIDTTILAWDVSAAAGRNDFAALPRVDPEKAWSDLAGDAGKAHAAIWQLTADPKRSVPFLSKRLHPATAPPRDNVARWITELDNANFATRQRAAMELRMCGDTIVSPLRAALRGKPSLEMRLRLEPILESARGWSRPLSDERLRAVRAVEVLEQIGTVAARRLLEKLAAGVEGASLTEDAQAALARLQRRHYAVRTP